MAERPGFVQLRVVSSKVEVISNHLNDAPAKLYVPVHSLVQVCVDNQVTTGMVNIYPHTSIEVKFSEEQAVRNAEIQVSSDKMAAELLIDYSPHVRVEMKDSPGGRIVQLQFLEIKTHPKPFNIQEVESVCMNAGVVYGLNLDNIKHLLETGRSGSCICALGKKPVQLVPERYELRIHSSEDPIFVGIVPVRPILTVRNGVLVAEHRPEVRGMSGTNVLGQAVVPEPVRTRLPRIGRGLEENGNGNVHSLRKGRVISTLQMLDVANTLVFENSLSVVEGHVQFDGDVIVHGDVNEGVEIVSGGQVFVTGFVSNAAIVADAGVIVSGGVFQSKISAGARHRVLNDLKEHLQSLQKEFVQFVAAAEQLHDALGIRAHLVGAGKLATTLLQDKFVDFLRWPKLILDWKQEYQLSLDSIWTKWIDQLAYEISQTRLQTARETYPWRSLLQEIEYRITEIISEVNSDVDIQVKNAQHSDMESTGRIIAVGQGFYQCKLKAHGEVLAQGAPGVILGCEVNAGNHVCAREIGSQAESTTTIHVESIDGFVGASIIHAGTLLSVAHWNHKVVKEMRDAHWP
jgi:uncharacterized protein